LIASFKTKMHIISPAVTEGVLRAVKLAEEQYEGLVIWQPSEPFSAGADLAGMVAVYQKEGHNAIEQAERRLQEMVLALRYAQVPVVVGLAGMALGGGCEMSVYAASRVAHIETYIGLVEVGVGLIPGAGGMAYAARRASEQQALGAPAAPLLSFLAKFAEAIAGAKVSRSALEARQIGYLRESDPIVMNVNEVLYVAVREAARLAASGWRPPVPSRFAVAGRDGAATLKAQLVNLRDGGFISAYDFELGAQVADVLCGGDVDPGERVNETWMLALERRAFMKLLSQPKTIERIGGLLKTGKPVRN
jgi:3-hydroxyacyl-CoA dehydrogenase